MRKTVGWKSELELELEEKEVELSVSRPGLKVPLGYKLGDGDVITLRIEQ